MAGLISHATTLALSLLALAAAPQKAPSHIDEIRIDKSDHTLELVVEGQVYKRYRVAIGPGGDGPKQWEGDMKTPVGRYRVIAEYGIFHRFLHVNYPNAEDRRRYAALAREGKVPAGAGIGHSIGIHGVNDPDSAGTHKERDWTLGCIALDDDEIDEIARLAPVGTPVIITQ